MRLLITPSGEVNTALNIGTGSGVFFKKVGTELQFKSLVAGGTISLTADNNEITIATGSGVGEANTASNLGAGQGLFTSKVGVDLRFKSLIAGSGTSFVIDANTITIVSSGGGGGGGSGETNTASNVGFGSGLVFNTKSGVDLQFRTLLSGSGIIVSTSGNVVRIDSTLEDDVAINAANITSLTLDFTNASGIWVKTASNQGLGENVFIQKTGADLEFRRLLQGSGIQISTSGNTLRIDCTLEDDVALLRTDLDNHIIDFNNSSGVFVKNAENLGGAGEWFIQKNANQNLEFRTVLGSSGIIATTSGNIIRLDWTHLDDFNILQTDFINASGIWIKNGANVGLGENVFSSKNGFNLEFRRLLGSSGIIISTSGDTLRIDSHFLDDFETLELDFANASGVWVKNGENLGTGSGLFIQKDTDKNLEFRTLLAGTNIGINQTANTLEIFSTGGGGGEVNDGANVGIGSGEVFAQKNGLNLEFRRLLAGSGLQIATSGNTIRFDWDYLDDFQTLELDFTNASGIWVKDGENLGTGSGIFFRKDPERNLEFKTLVAGGGIEITGDVNELTITSVASGAGESNTASNVGLGLGVFDTKSGVDLRFKSLFPGSGIQIIASGSSIVFHNDLTDNVTILETDKADGIVEFIGKIITGSGNLHQPVKLVGFNTEPGEPRIPVIDYAGSIDDAIGIITDTNGIPSGSSGVIQTHGLVRHINTTEFSEDQILFPSGTGSTVELWHTLSTNQQPQRIAQVLEASTSGSIFLLGSWERKKFDHITNEEVTSVLANADEFAIYDLDAADGRKIVASDASTYFNIDFTNVSGIFVKDGVNIGGSPGEVFSFKNASQILEFRTLLGGSGIKLVTSGNIIRVDAHVIQGQNLGTASGVFVQRDVDGNLEFRTIRAGTNIGINQSATELEIYTTNLDEATTASNVGIGSGRVFAQEVANDLQFRQLLAGSGLQIATSGNTIRFDWDYLDDFQLLQTDVITNRTDFDNSSGVFVKDALNIGGALGQVFSSKNANQILELRTLLGGSGIKLVTSGNIIRIDAHVIDGQNLGTASGVFVQKDTDGNLEFRTIRAGTNIGINQSATELEIYSTAAGGGETNDGANVGIGSGEVFAQKNGVNLEFRRLLAGSGLQIATSGNTIRFDWDYLDDFQLLQTDVTNNRTDFDNSSGIFVKNGENVGGAPGQVFGVKNANQNLEFRTLIGGSGIITSTSGNIVRFDWTHLDDFDLHITDFNNHVTDFNNSSGIFLKTLEDLGGAAQLFIQKNANQNAEIRTILGGSGIIALASGNVIRLDWTHLDDFDLLQTEVTNNRTDFDNASGIWVKNGENLGIGSGIFVQKDSTQNLEFRTLIAGTNVGINQTATTLEIFSITGGAGETNTASNIGIGLGEVFSNKSGVDLRFRRLLAGSGLQIATSGNTIRFDNEGIAQGITVGKIPKFLNPTQIGDSVITEVSNRIGIGTSDPSGVVQIEGDMNTPFHIQTTAEGTTTVNLSNSNLVHLTVEASPTLQFISAHDGGKYSLVLKQNNQGSGLINVWPTTFAWRGGSAPTLTATSGAIDIVTFIYDNTNDIYYADVSNNFS